MSVIRLSRLGGLRPSSLPRALPDGDAQVAHNLHPGTLEFRPLPADTQVATLPVSDPQTLYRFARSAGGALNSDLSAGWQANAKALSYARGQVDDNATERVYYAPMDASVPPRVLDATGVDKPLGVPPPTTAPTATLQEVYTFTEEQKVTEKRQTHQKVLEAIDTHTAAITEGLSGALPATGWLRRSSFDPSPASEKALVRIFALNPQTRQVIDTYSSMPVSESAWVFDPALGGDYSEKPPGFVLPSWAAGHSLWWVVPFTAFARVYWVNKPALSLALQGLDMPGTQGTRKYVTAAEADHIVHRIAEKYDLNALRVRSLLDTLDDRQRKVAVLFDRGGAAAVGRAVQDFYARPDVAVSIASATSSFAEAIWRYAEMIGTATAQPWYQRGNTDGDGGP